MSSWVEGYFEYFWISAFNAVVSTLIATVNRTVVGPVWLRSVMSSEPGSNPVMPASFATSVSNAVPKPIATSAPNWYKIRYKS